MQLVMNRKSRMSLWSALMAVQLKYPSERECSQSFRFICYVMMYKAAVDSQPIVITSLGIFVNFINFFLEDSKLSLSHL